MRARKDVVRPKKINTEEPKVQQGISSPKSAKHQRYRPLFSLFGGGRRSRRRRGSWATRESSTRGERIWDRQSRSGLSASTCVIEGRTGGGRAGQGRADDGETKTGIGGPDRRTGAYHQREQRDTSGKSEVTEQSTRWRGEEGVMYSETEPLQIIMTLARPGRSDLRTGTGAEPSGHEAEQTRSIPRCLPPWLAGWAGLGRQQRADITLQPAASPGPQASSAGLSSPPSPSKVITHKKKKRARNWVTAGRDPLWWASGLFQGSEFWPRDRHLTSLIPPSMIPIPISSVMPIKKREKSPGIIKPGERGHSTIGAAGRESPMSLLATRDERGNGHTHCVSLLSDSSDSGGPGIGLAEKRGAAPNPSAWSPTARARGAFFFFFFCHGTEVNNSPFQSPGQTRQDQTRQINSVIPSIHR